jgi:predicted small secreted protein
MTMKKTKSFFVLLLVLSFLLAPSLAYAAMGEDISYAARGAGKIVGGVFAIPKAMMQDSGRVMFPFGLVTGALRGTVQTVTGVVGGVVDVARGGAPYAKYAALAL